MYILGSGALSFEEDDAFDVVRVREQVCSDAFERPEWWCTSLFFGCVTQIFHISDLGDCITGNVDEFVEALACSERLQDVFVETASRGIYDANDLVVFVGVLFGDFW